MAPEVPEKKGLGRYYPAFFQAPSQVAKGVQVANICSGQLGPKSQRPSLQRLEVAEWVLMLTSLETQLTDWLSISEERQLTVMVGEHRAERRKGRLASGGP